MCIFASLINHGVSRFVRQIDATTPLHVSVISCLLALAPCSQAQLDDVSLQIASFRLVDGSRAELSFPTAPDLNYTLQWAPDLVHWNPVVLPLQEPGGDGAVTHRFPLPAGSGPNYFRIEYRAPFVNPTPLSSLNAPGEGIAFRHLPTMGMPLEDPSETAFADGPVPVSLTHVLVNLDASTTVARLNELLASEGLTLAGAIPRMRLALLRREFVEGSALDDVSALLQRLSASGLFTAVAPSLGSRPAVPDGGDPGKPDVEPDVAMLVGAQAPAHDWEWDPAGLGQGFGGNNAFELSRVPQLWNWLDYGHRLTAFPGGGHKVAVMDFGFLNHNEFGSNVALRSSPGHTPGTSELNHGTAVLGVIAARSDNLGIQGVTPFPSQVVGITFPRNSASGTTASAVAYSQTQLTLIDSLLSEPVPPKVINISAGFDWSTLGDPTVTVRPDGTGNLWSDWVDDLGEVWACSFENLNLNIATPNYLVVAAAGNGAPAVDASYGNASSNIAGRPDLSSRVPQFLTVENVLETGVTSSRSYFDRSGLSAAVSAGGTDVTVLRATGSFATESGTSYSAPLVAGIASFLWTLEPTLTTEEVKALLRGDMTSQEMQSAAGAPRAPLVDGFAAALGIDRLRGNKALHRALVDVDDGTADGNLREVVLSFSKDPDQIHTPDGRRGDGTVNMKDFRVFRDAFLHSIGVTDHLDGPPTHFKRDLNFDGLVFDQPVSPGHPAPYSIASQSGDSLVESFYSRYDYNGNGFLDAENQSFGLSTPAHALSPVGVDPDTTVNRWNPSQGIVRDIDVLFDPAIWSPGEENVVLTRPDDTPPGGWNRFSHLPPEEWTASYESSISSYLHSFDLHLDMDAGDPGTASHQAGYLDYIFEAGVDGLWIGPVFGEKKGRIGAWEGVVTIHGNARPLPHVGLHYKKTVGDQFHQYWIHFQPEAGEDIGVSVGFDELQFYSTTRGGFTGFHPHDDGELSQEIIAKIPGSDPYETFRVADDEVGEVEERARVMAFSAVRDLLKFPTVFNGSPALRPIYETRSDPLGGGSFVDVFGLIAEYESISAP